MYGTAKPGLCILTQILPQVYTYNEPKGNHLFSPGKHPHVKQATPMLISAPVGFGIARSAAMGTDALVKGDLELTALTTEVNQDLQQLEFTMNQLQDQINSLAKMVLQN